MVTERYKQYLRSPAWQRKRAAAFAYYGKKCYACGASRGPLHIHHVTYVRLGKEAIKDLRPLCIPCHKAVTALHWKMGKRRVTGEVVMATYMKMTSAQRSQYRKK